MIDLRSDTVTRPCPAMLDAMLKTQVGDDVFNEDPTVNELQEYAANLFGMQRALFCPSGTMSNQIAISLHTGPLTEVITEKLSHIFLYEGGGIAHNSRASVKTLDGERGKLTVKQIAEAINPNDIHRPVTSLVSLENSTNKGGGACYSKEELSSISKLCRDKQLKLHLDGARVFNALTETSDLTTKDLGTYFDTISICLSKGLGSPLGSLLLLSTKDYPYALRMRKVLGGGMRQVGYMAACGLFALKNNIERLKEDHLLASNIGELLNRQNWVESILKVETNIVIFELVKDVNPVSFLSYLETKNIYAVAFGGQQIRFVTHKDLPSDSFSELKKALLDFTNELIRK